MNKPTLTFKDLACGYGDTIVIRGISGQIAPGQVLGVLGRNGVGKSTLVKALAGVLPMAEGQATWGDHELGTLAAHARLRAGISYAPQENVVFGELSVEDNLWLHLKGRRDERYQQLLQTFPRLDERRQQRAGTLSGGERKLLSFARTLGLSAQLSMLDEPTEGVQPENIDRMAALINERVAQGQSFLVVEQNLTFLEAIATQVLVLDHGQAVLEGVMKNFSREQLEAHLVV